MTHHDIDVEHFGEIHWLRVRAAVQKWYVHQLADQLKILIYTYSLKKMIYQKTYKLTFNQDWSVVKVWLSNHVNWCVDDCSL